MNDPRAHAKYDLWNLQSSTQRSKDRVESAINRANYMKDDVYKNKRQKERLCVWCYYNSGTYGQSFCNYECARCLLIKTHSDTGVPFLCDDCSKATNLCQKCGSHREGEMIKEVP